MNAEMGHVKKDAKVTVVFLVEVSIRIVYSAVNCQVKHLLAAY